MYIHFIVVRTCSVEGCEMKYHAKGLCKLHYRQLPENKLYQKEYNKQHYAKPENKLKKKERDSKPENKLKKKEHASKPENKLKKKEYDKKYESKPERKLKKKEYDSKPENKLNKKEYNKEYRSKPERKLKKKEYDSKPENKLRQKEYNKEYKKQHPEIGLKSQQKLFKKLGKILGYQSKQIPMLYYSWAKTVKKILGNYCQVCGSIKQIEVHHIFHKVKYPLLSLNENNGIPLCKLCHLQADGKMLLV